MLIFKFAPGRIMDLVAQPSSWTDPTQFNTSSELSLISQRLTTYIAVAAESNDPFYNYFNQIVVDPNWQGVLALNVDIDLPAELLGMLGGMDTTRPTAHHLGIEISAASTNGSAGTSSLFGLIDYVDTAYANQLADGADLATPVASRPGEPYDFKVLTLKVLLANNAIKDFRSAVQLTANELFGEPATGSTPGTVTDPDFSIRLDGTFQSFSGERHYQHYAIVDSPFWLGNYAARSGRLTAVDFFTVAPSTTANSGEVRAQFDIWGYLSPGAIAEIDGFSSEQKQAALGLERDIAFSNAFVVVDFTSETSANRTFTFGMSEVDFDPSS